jgi:hypothetical protein
LAIVIFNGGKATAARFTCATRSAAASKSDGRDVGRKLAALQQETRENIRGFLAEIRLAAAGFEPAITGFSAIDH